MTLKAKIGLCMMLAPILAGLVYFAAVVQHGWFFPLALLWFGTAAALGATS